MLKKKNLTGCIILITLFTGVFPVFGQQVPRAPGAIARTLRGMNITLGNWWFDYNPANNPPTLQWAGSDWQEREVDYRRRLLREYNFTMMEKSIAEWNEFPQITATSIMAGKPAATVFSLQPNWAANLHRQSLLYPVSDSRAINWSAVTPVEWNRAVRTAFTYNNKTYAFAEGYGRSEHAALVFFNKRLFREAGLDPNLPYDLQKNGQWTWDRYLEICKQLTRDLNNDGITDIYAMTMDLSTENLDAIISSNGAMYVDKDPRTGRYVNASGRPEFLEAVRFYIKLRDEGVMKPRPDGSAWDWFVSEFMDGKVAIRIAQQYLATNDLMNMKDDWGMVVPPKGPRVKNYVIFNDENVMIIPAKTPPAQVDAILWAVQAWLTPPDPDWKLQWYARFRDRRAVDETMALIRDQKLWQWKYHLHIPGLERGGIAWQIYGHNGDPAQLIEAVTPQWNALIADANDM